MEEKETAVGWKDLEENVLYKISAIVKPISVYGVCYILTLVKKSGKECSVFAPKSLIGKFRQKRRPPYSSYLLSLGFGIYQATKHRKH